jgi:hypothetical protein
MNHEDIMYNAFSDEMEKISVSFKALGLTALGAGGVVGAGEMKRRWDAGTKELAEQRMERMQKRLQRMNTMHSMKYDD